MTFSPAMSLMKCGNVLLSHTVSRTVPSALCGLTSVFGMRTGGSHMILSPQWYIISPLSAARLISLFIRSFNGASTDNYIELFK